MPAVLSQSNNPYTDGVSSKSFMVLNPVDIVPTPQSKEDYYFYNRKDREKMLLKELRKKLPQL